VRRGQGNKLNVGPKTKKRPSEVSSHKWNLKRPNGINALVGVGSH